MKSFYKDMSHATSQRLTACFADAIAKSCPSLRHLSDMVAEERYTDLANASTDYRGDRSVVDLIGERQILGFFSKNLSLPLGIDRAAAAYTKFLESEESCRSVNRRIRSCNFGKQFPVGAVLYHATRKISYILGTVPSLEELNFSFGPGANVNVRGLTSARWKLSSRPACSSDMLGIISDVLSELPQMSQLWGVDHGETWSVPVDVMPGELMFVPKNAKTDRTIIVEASLNTLVQKGVGELMKERLLEKAGINLYDQSESKRSNRKRAQLASIHNHLATIDLSSASDTVSKLLVESLLPSEWYDFLCHFRTGRIICKQYGYDAEVEKFSSMGNGFTFELETLLFYALTYGCCIVEGIHPDISVYGDDIIAPSAVVPLMRTVFTECGFTINDQKSYVDGPFRESCGGDFFLGQDIRPYYQKKSWSMADLFSFHNFIVEKHLDLMFPELLDAVLSAIPPAIRRYGPAGYGDGHLVDRDWVRSKIYKKSRGWAGGVFTTWIQSPRRVIAGLLPGDYILPYYMAGRSPGEPTDHYHVRGSTKLVREIRVYTLK